jgi:hypothetical protein
MSEKREAAAPVRPTPAGNTATGTLKLIAVWFMLIDHLGVVVYPQIEEMRIIGRIAFPIYCWCMVVGFHYTRSVPKYLGRVLLTGVLVQPLYAFVMKHVGNTGNFLRDYFAVQPSIFLTLFLALAALWGIREKKFLSHLWAPAAAVILATVLNADYGWKGVLLFILLYACRERSSAIAAVMVAFFLFWGASYNVTTNLFGIPLSLDSLPDWIGLPLRAFMRLETYALLSLPFILLPFSRDVRLPKWLAYGLYPAHLILIILLKLMVFG